VELEAVLGQEELSPERRREVVCHLTQGCQPCLAVLAKALPGQEPISQEENDAYDRAITSSLEWALRMERHRQEEEDWMRAAALLAYGGGPLAIAKGDMPLEGLGVYQALLERSWAMRHDNPREMVKLAKTAADLAKKFDSALHGVQKIADYQARAWGELGNAHRVANDLWEAQRAFGKAFQLLEQGTGDRFLRVRLHDLHASLLGTLRKFDLAFQSLDVVVDLYKEINDMHSAGRALITKAVYTHYSGRPEDALTINQQGLALVDHAADPGLPVVALHNQLWFLVACGRYKAARILLFKNRQKINDNGKITGIKLRWLDGQISYGLADYSTAESIFQEVKTDFEAEGLGFAAALASLDLAMAQMRQGKCNEAKLVVMEAAGVFAALNIHREVLGAIELLRDAFRIDKATIALVERVVSFIREWEINPDIRLMPAPE
jgi:tetratricopeptide (TPR) repeat protein